MRKLLLGRNFLSTVIDDWLLFLSEASVGIVNARKRHIVLELIYLIR